MEGVAGSLAEVKRSDSACERGCDRSARIILSCTRDDDEATSLKGLVSTTICTSGPFELGTMGNVGQDASML